MADPYIFSYTFQDTNGVKATADYYYVPTTPATVEASQLIADYNTLGGLLDAASNAEIVAGKITIPQILPISPWKTTPVEENDVSDIINVNYDVAGSRYVWSGILPNLKNVELVGGRVDPTQTDLAALIAAVVGGGAHGAYSNQQSQDVNLYHDSFQADRKHRRQLRARSLAPSS